MPVAVVARTDKRSNKNRRLPLLAQSGRANPVSECLLLGVKRTALLSFRIQAQSRFRNM